MRKNAGAAGRASKPRACAPACGRPLTGRSCSRPFACGSGCGPPSFGAWTPPVQHPRAPGGFTSLTHVPAPHGTHPGAQVELARYELPDGPRILVGQRIDGQVAVIDVPAGPEGHVYLVERAVPSQAELDGLVAEYTERSEAAGMPALLASWRIFDDLGASS